MRFLTLLSFVHTTYSNICTSDTYFIDNYQDFDQLNNCSILDANLFINGEYSSENLTALSNITQINGFLVIIDSHTVSNLKGLNNLARIEGNELYLDRYSVAIKHNVGANTGLCYADRVLWENITDHPINIDNNAVGCADCHNECIGCFGPGPKLCQYCKNFKFFDTCVSNCPSTYIRDICDKVVPSKPILDGNILENNSINIYWNKSNIYDIVDSINIYLDNVLYHNLSPFRNNYNINNLLNSRTYKIEVQFVNRQGESNKSSSLYIQSIESTTLTSTHTTTLTSTPRTTSTPSTTLTSTLSTTLTSTDITTSQPNVLSTTSVFQTTTDIPNNVSIHNTNTEDDTTWWLFLLIPVGIILIVIVIILVVIHNLDKPNKKKIYPDQLTNRPGLNNPIYGTRPLTNIPRLNNPICVPPIVKRTNNPLYNSSQLNRIHNNHIYESNYSQSSEESV